MSASFDPLEFMRDAYTRAGLLPDESDDGDGFTWDRFWQEQEARLDAKREDFLP